LKEIDRRLILRLTRPFEIVVSDLQSEEMQTEEKVMRPRKALALKLGMAGGGMGLLSGFVHLVSGSRLSSITGHEENTLVLGLLTIIFSGFALYCTYRSSRETSIDINRRIAWLLGILIPSVICFTTVGFLWILPGFVFFIAVGILVYEMIKEFEEAGELIIATVPYWKRTTTLAGVFVIIIPLVFGTFTENTELSSFKDDEGTYYIHPMSSVKKEGIDGNETSSQVIGVMIVHMVLMIGAFSALISGQLGARTITIGVGVGIALALLFFFIITPNILFIEGARMSQFDADHFSSISGGWYMAMFGTILLVASQFIKLGKDKDKLTE
jgi:hypothetical protein